MAILHYDYENPVVIDSDAVLEPCDKTPERLITNETFTASFDTVRINPDLLEMMVGTAHFIRGAVIWASGYCTDMFHYAMFSKKTRTRKKYVKRILAAYRAMLWEGCE